MHITLTMITLLGLFTAGEPLLAAVKPVPAPWLRLDGGIGHLKAGPRGKHLAFTDEKGMGLHYMDLRDRKIIRISRQKIGASWMWSPGGFRIFYRELVRTPDHRIESRLQVYDIGRGTSMLLATLPSSSGLLTYDPRDMRLHLMHKKGILNRQIVFPDERLARWQIARRTENGKWVASQKGILRLTWAGFNMRRLDDDGSGVHSFDISPDGSRIAWSTTAGEIHVSRRDEPPVRLGYGRDPVWHPQKPLLIYAAARRVGARVISYDLRLVDHRGSGRYLTKTQSRSERWPRWEKEGRALIYTLAGTTDLYRMELRP